jgi:FeS assembly protein IscX
MSDLNWDASYAVAKALMAAYPRVDLHNVSIDMIYRWTLDLPNFSDDPELVNDSILMAIYQEWYEEINSL